MVGFFEGFGVGFGEGSFCLCGGSGISVGDLLGAILGAEAGVGWVGEKGKFFERSRYS